MLVQLCPLTHLHSLQSLQESVRHSSSNNHLIHFIQQVFNQLNLVLHFGTGQVENDILFFPQWLMLTHPPKMARKGFFGLSRALEKYVNSFFMRKPEALMECSTPTIELYITHKVVYTQLHNYLPVSTMGCTKCVIDKNVTKFCKGSPKGCDSITTGCDL